MRPVNDKNSTLRTPLNDILGYEGNLRLLRCLVESQYSMSYSELAKRTGLSLPGIHKVVPRLMETGIIQHTGSGRRQQVALRKGHPLLGSLVQLFRSEQAYFSSLLDDLKKRIDKLDIPPTSAWIFGSVAEGTDEYGDALQLSILGELKTIDNQVEQLKNHLYHSEFERTYDVTLDLRGITKADLKSRPKLTEDVMLLWGADPSKLIEKEYHPGTKPKGHQAFDRQSLENAQYWSKLLETYPETIQRTIRNLETRMTQTDSREEKELQEWKYILESMSLQRLKRFLESGSQRATRLRQSLPFWPVLTESEREHFKKIRSKAKTDE